MLVQSSVPLNYWDEAEHFALTLINMIPSTLLNWNSPSSVLIVADSMLKQTQHVGLLLPFGLKVFVHDQNPKSKVAPPSKSFLFLGFEPRSDAMRFLDPISR
jgi:hypothetical protein